ncbi:hypothetical protein PPL_06154 [Heterostelium album PN500]|uniref:Uncharacterized protein n=1 Tax=Heterostelium pallidum (strain ATCC 26659 / Pp 5 / PN500) TaxID=670386 RepID=D3BCC9_HETP5|nr:hypothetical protein PPL_06154 [Heterostelium album PN500]EFA80919.1 hypothetical protein PPL_06154 [Heterostelium album PN500]|eukprot:XP_020433037.1 hypothetical protein PPL_06154 [Heterostelium album PN500]
MESFFFRMSEGQALVPINLKSGDSTHSNQT